MFDAGKTRMIELPYGEKNCDNILSRFHLIAERYGQTDRRTDRYSYSPTAAKPLSLSVCSTSGPSATSTRRYATPSHRMAYTFLQLSNRGTSRHPARPSWARHREATDAQRRHVRGSCPRKASARIASEEVSVGFTKCVTLHEKLRYLHTTQWSRLQSMSKAGELHSSSPTNRLLGGVSEQVC